MLVVSRCTPLSEPVPDPVLIVPRQRLFAARVVVRIEQAQLKGLQSRQEAHRRPRVEDCRACLGPTASRWSERIRQSGELGHVSPLFRGRGCQPLRCHLGRSGGFHHPPPLPGRYLVCIAPGFRSVRESPVSICFGSSDVKDTERCTFSYFPRRTARILPAVPRGVVGDGGRDAFERGL